MVVRHPYLFAASIVMAVLPLRTRAQVPGDAGVAAALARVSPGSTLRVQTCAGEVLEGMLRLAGDSLRLDVTDRIATLALGNVRSAWLRERRTKTGAIIGALLGGAGGGAFLGFFGLLADVEEAGRFVLVGAVAGAGAGGLVGGVIGAAVPRWSLIFPADADIAAPPARPDAAGRRRLGAFEAAAGYGRIGGEEPTGGGPGGRLGLHAEFGTDPASGRDSSWFFSVGPELGWFDLGGTGLVRREFVNPASPAGEADTLEFSRRYTAFTAGGLLRLGIATTRVRGYGLAGLAYNRWDFEQRDERWLGPGTVPPAFASGDGRFEHLGYTVGAGLQTILGHTLAMTADLRRTGVGTFDMDLPGHYWTITLGASRRW